jgi:hypothetical protein
MKIVTRIFLLIVGCGVVAIYILNELSIKKAKKDTMSKAREAKAEKAELKKMEIAKEENDELENESDQDQQNLG